MAKTINREVRGRPTTNKKLAAEANAWADKLRAEQEKRKAPKPGPKK